MTRTYLDKIEILEKTEIEMWNRLEKSVENSHEHLSNEGIYYLLDALNVLSDLRLKVRPD